MCDGKLLYRTLPQWHTLGGGNSDNRLPRIIIFLTIFLTHFYSVSEKNYKSPHMRTEKHVY